MSSWRLSADNEGAGGALVIVVDTNVIAYCFIRSGLTEVAQQVRARDADWHAPFLWRSEFRNVLCGYLRRGLFPLADLELVRAATEQALTGREHFVSGQRVLSVAATSGLSACDAEFVALAEDLGVPLVTTDAGVLKAFPHRAIAMQDYLALDDGDATSMHIPRVAYAVAPSRGRRRLKDAFRKLSEVQVQV